MVVVFVLVSLGASLSVTRPGYPPDDVTVPFRLTTDDPFPFPELFPLAGPPWDRAGSPPSGDAVPCQ